MSDSHDDDPFLVTSRLGITSVLRALKTQNTLVHMRLPRDTEAIITTVLDVDPDKQQIVIDAAADDAFNQRLAKAEQMHFDALVDKIRVQFTAGNAHPQQFEGRQAFRLSYPDSLRRIQRRDHYRIDIPVSMPLLCQIPRKGSKPLALPVKDISVGGLAMLDHHEEVSESEGALLRDCALDLDDIGTVMTHLRIRRIINQNLGDSKAVRIVACEFVHPDPSNNIMLQNYIGRLDRLLNARRRGFD